MEGLRKISGKFLVAFFCLGIVVSSVFAGDIVVFGDSQHDQNVQRKIVGEILKYKPAAVFRVGDLVNDGYSKEQWQEFRAINEKLLKTGEYFPALGNHERDSPLYFENFPYLRHQRWYSVERQGIHFIVLDSNFELRVGSKQYQWLEDDLRGVKDTIKFKIVIFHHPLFGVSRIHMGDEKKIKPVLMPLFEKYGVCAVFSGHDHNYERFEYEGITFITTGGGGSNLREQERTSPYLKKFAMAWHFCLISPQEDTLNVKVLDSSSNVLDEFEISAPVLSGV